MKNGKKLFALGILFALTLGNLNAQPGNPVVKEVDACKAEKLREAVEAKPDDFDTHLAYTNAMKLNSRDLIKQYDEWIKKYPRSVMFPFAIGLALPARAKAEPYLLKALEVDPTYHKVYYHLWRLAKKVGEFDKARDYILKAKELDPKNVDYAFYYAYSFNGSNPEIYKKLSLEVAKNFPDSHRGSEALYWLALRTNDRKEKIAIYEQLRKNFPADKFDLTNLSMSYYFSLLLISETPKAMELVQSMVAEREEKDKAWQANLTLVNYISEAKAMMAAGKATEAVAVVDKIKLPGYSQFLDEIILFKAEVQDAAKNPTRAYQTLLTFTAKEPIASINKRLISYGKKLGKDKQQVNKDILYARDTASKQAPNFTLENYLTKAVSSLSDYKGKVVLLTYWFPGCGPCIAEFPHFENVVRKFKRSEFVYLGININEREDEYVMPLVQSRGYSFIPLKDNKKWTKGPLDNKHAAPVNFLINQKGQIIFAGFRTDGHNEGTLEMMINSLLTGKSI